MPKTKATAATATDGTVPPQITDPAQDAALIASRLAYWGREHGYGSTVVQALTDLGLGAYAGGLGAQKVTLTIPEETLAELLTFEVSGEVNAYNVADAVYSQWRDRRDAVYGRITDGTATFQAPGQAEPVFSAEELIGTFGPFGDLPTGTDEVIEARRELLLSMARWADTKGLCDTADSALQRIGATPFLPSREVTISAEIVPWGTVTATVATCRTGEVKEDAARYALRNAVKELQAKSINEAQFAVVTPA